MLLVCRVEDIIRRFQEELIHERKELLEQQKVFDVRFAQKVYAAGTSQVCSYPIFLSTVGMCLSAWIFPSLVSFITYAISI